MAKFEKEIKEIITSLEKISCKGVECDECPLHIVGGGCESVECEILFSNILAKILNKCEKCGHIAENKRSTLN